MNSDNTKRMSAKEVFAKIGNVLRIYVKNYWWKLLVIVFLLAIDLVTKSLIVRFDGSGDVVQYKVDIIKNVLLIIPTVNEGAAWSIFSGKTIFLIILTFSFLTVFVIFDLLYKKKSVFYGLATGMVFAGAVGNLIDRLIFGKVRDFIYFAPINFPVFNFADIYLTIGIILFSVYVLFFMGKDKKNDTNYQKKINMENADKNNDDTTEVNETYSQNSMRWNNEAISNAGNGQNNTNDTNSQKKNLNIGESDAKDNC